MALIASYGRGSVLVCILLALELATNPRCTFAYEHRCVAGDTRG